MELELHDGLYHTHDLGEFYLPDVNPGGASSIVPPLLVYLKNVNVDKQLVSLR